MLGSAVIRRLASEKSEILVADRRTLDLTNQRATEEWLAQLRPDAIVLAAGLAGGIYANNTYPADFIANNLAIALNVIRGRTWLASKSSSPLALPASIQNLLRNQ